MPSVATNSNGGGTSPNGGSNGGTPGTTKDNESTKTLVTKNPASPAANPTMKLTPVPPDNNANKPSEEESGLSLGYFYFYVLSM